VRDRFAARVGPAEVGDGARDECFLLDAAALGFLTNRREEDGSDGQQGAPTNAEDRPRPRWRFLGYQPTLSSANQHDGKPRGYWMAAGPMRRDDVGTTFVER